MSDMANSTGTSRPGADTTQARGGASAGYPSGPTQRGTVERISAILHAPLALLRFLIRRFLWVLVRTGRAIWRHPIVTLLVIIGGFLAYQGVGSYLTIQSGPSDVRQYEIVEPIPPPIPVIEYLSAQRSFDADAMWNTYSESTKAANLAQGGSLETLRQTTDQMRLQGLRYGESRYVGGYQLQGNRAYYFYVTQVEDQRGRSAEIYQVFLADTNGKILHVEDPQIPIAHAAQW